MEKKVVEKDSKRQILLKNVNLFDVEKGILRNNQDILIEDDLICNSHYLT
jgi:hypothetical protein